LEKLEPLTNRDKLARVILIKKNDCDDCIWNASSYCVREERSWESVSSLIIKQS
jgi:hypothetical protein